MGASQVRNARSPSLRRLGLLWMGFVLPQILAGGAPVTVNVRDAVRGARGNGIADDTAAIQSAVNAVAGRGGTVRIPKGVYLVDAEVSIRLKSDMTLALDPGAVLKAMPNGAAHSAILLVADASRVTIRGGTLEGEREGHTGRGGEWGHGLSLARASHVRVEGVTAKGCWGDGFYVSSSSDVTFQKVVADHNRRQGMSITSVDGLVVRDSIFMHTAGTLPEDGLDIEPNPGETVNQVLITGCTFSDNAGFGIEIGVPLSYSGQAWIRGVVVDSNTCRGNGVNTLSRSPRAGIEASNCSGLRILHNSVSDNGVGILLRNNANGFEVMGNVVTGNAGDGIQQYLCSANTIRGNTVTGNRGHGISSPNSSVEGVGLNTLSGNAATR